MKIIMFFSYGARHHTLIVTLYKDICKDEINCSVKILVFSLAAVKVSRSGAVIEKLSSYPGPPLLTG